MIKLLVNTTSGNYPIIIGSNIISKISSILTKNYIKFNNCLLIIDNKVPKKMISIIKKSIKNKKIYIHLFKANEKNKDQKSVNNILKILLEKNFSRQDCLITIGGGIAGDVGGYAASIFKRGLKFINIPTTLLSQVDSSIGGKTGINTKYGKNLIGNFYQPNLVLSDTKFLHSLPKREIVCGYAEILKHSLIADKNFYKYLNKNFNNIIKLKEPFIENAIFKSCKIKKYFVEKDEKEKNLRKVLNFGHTFGHAYEATLGYSKKLNHGEAVLLGIFSALNFSKKNNYLNNKEYNLIYKHLSKANLPHRINKYFSKKDLKNILNFMDKDKKNKSKLISLILLRKIGRPIINKQFNRNKIKLFLDNELIN